MASLYTLYTISLVFISQVSFIKSMKLTTTTVLPLMVNTLGPYGHADSGSGRCYVLDITLYLLQRNGINNELEIYNI